MTNEEQEFKDKHCKDCINKQTDKCEIRRNIQGILQCVYEKK